MPITYDITKDRLFNKGLEAGREEGLEQQKDRMILKSLDQGILTVEQIAEMAEVSIDYVLSLNSKN